MKKILIITHNFPPESVGRASRIYELAKFLKNHFKILVLCPPPTFPFTKYGKECYLYSKENFEDLELFRLWTFQPSKNNPTSFQRIMYYLGFSFFSSIFLLIKSRKVSAIIFSTPPQSTLFATLIARLIRKKIIIDVGDLWETAGGHNVNRGFLRKRMKNFEINCYKKSDAVITNNLIIQNIVKEICGKNDSSKVIYFPYNVDLNKFKKHDVKRESEIVYIGNYGPLQNIESIIEAIPIVIQKFPELKLQLYGGGDSESKLKNLVKELKIEKFCKFNKPIPSSEIPLVLSKSQVGIVPLAMLNELRYATPTKIFEYFACELPVFSYGPSLELERLLTESGSGINVKSDDPKKIAEGLIQFLQNEKRLEDFSSNGRRFVEMRKDSSQIRDLINHL